MDTPADVRDMYVVADAMLGLLHDLNNNLNCMVLHAAVLQAKVDPALRDELMAIRQEGARAGARLRVVERFRDRRRRAKEAVDLNEVCAAAVADAAGVQLAPAAGGPARVEVNPLDVRRLADYLLRVL